MFNLFLQTALSDVFTNYANAVSLGDLGTFGVIITLIVFGFLMWKLRINLTAGIFIAAVLLGGMASFSGTGSLWFILEIGLGILTFIAFGYGLLRFIK